MLILISDGRGDIYSRARLDFHQRENLINCAKGIMRVGSLSWLIAGTQIC